MKKNLFIHLFVTAVFCCLFFTCISCKSAPVENEYEYVFPVLNFPEWPNPGNEDFEINFDKRVIEVPLSYWDEIFYYKKDIEAVEEYYLKYKNLYLKKEE